MFYNSGKAFFMETQLKADENNSEKESSLIILLRNLTNDSSLPTVSLGSLVDALNKKSFVLLLLVLVLPNCVPIPVPPGVSTVLALPLLFLSLQLMLGRKTPWLPESWKRYTIKRSLLIKTVNAIEPYLKKIDSVLKPRMLFLIKPGTERILGFCWLMFSISVAIPLPMTNFVPSVGLLISALGRLERDGFVMLTGLIIGFSGCVFTVALLTFGVVILKDILLFLG